MNSLLDLPAILSFDEDFFSCIDPITDKLVSGYKYLYSEVTEIVMRVRPEHADIRYECFKLLSSCYSYCNFLFTIAVL